MHAAVGLEVAVVGLSHQSVRGVKDEHLTVLQLSGLAREPGEPRVRDQSSWACLNGRDHRALLKE